MYYSVFFFLKVQIIFRGEVSRAPGSLSYEEQTAEYILFTTNSTTLAVIEEHEKRLYINPFVPGTI